MYIKDTGPLPSDEKSRNDRMRDQDKEFMKAMFLVYPEKLGIAPSDPDARPRRVLPANANPGWNGSQLGDF